MSLKSTIQSAYLPRLYRLPSIALATLILGSSVNISLAQSIITEPKPITLPGSTDFDGWNQSGLNNTGNPGFPGFPGSPPWPNPIGSNVTGSGDATLNKVSGNAYPAAASIYFGSFTLIPNKFGGRLAVADSTPLSGVKTIILQMQIGESLGFDLFGGLPVLNYNSGSQQISPNYSALWANEPNGTFPVPGGGEEPLFINLRAFQWDLTSLGPITNFNIQFSAVEHAQLYALQLDQGSIMTVIVPEPATISLILLVALALLPFVLRCRISSQGEA